jgi:hypothetical protein
MAEQVASGLVVRMAILLEVLRGGDRPEPIEVRAGAPELDDSTTSIGQPA